MQTKQFKIEGTPRDEAALDAAAALLRAGKLVVIPTETVYGLAANALDPAAAAAIYTAKGRPCDNPLIVHIASLDELPPLVKAVPDALYRLADRFWPGPMTVILEKSDLVPSATTGGLDTVAVRMPAHPAARADPARRRPAGRAVGEPVRFAKPDVRAPLYRRSGRPR